MRDSSEYKRTRMVVGRLAYASPEQIKGHRLDRTTDLYSLGIVLYEALAGERPFKADSDMELRELVARGGIDPAKLDALDVPEALSMVIRKAVQPDREQRYQTAADMVRDLSEFLRGQRALRQELSGYVHRMLQRGTSQQEEPITLLESEVLTETTSEAYSVPATVDVGGSRQPVYLDENVQFTVYRPRSVQPEKWYDLLAFAHLSERRPDAPPEEPDPTEEVKRQAELVLAEHAQEYKDTTQDSSQAVPRQGELTFVPYMPGVQFNPPSRTFIWEESVHREEFRMKAAASLDGTTARGSMTVFLGRILLAEVTLAVKIDSRDVADYAVVPEPSVRPYRRIFASYSHKDLGIVDEFERYAPAGDQYVRDMVHLRAGEVWDEQLRRLIDTADVFQLFWSWNSLQSRFVENEWRYALSLHRRCFVRPVYWEEPFPEVALPNLLPPDELRRLQFQRVFPLVNPAQAGVSSAAGSAQGKDAHLFYRAPSCESGARTEPLSPARPRERRERTTYVARPRKPLATVRVVERQKDGSCEVEVCFLLNPDVLVAEGRSKAFLGLDASASMAEMYGRGGSLFTPKPNYVEAVARKLGAVLSNVSKNGKVGAAYWAVNSPGDGTEWIGEFSEQEWATAEISGPKGENKGRDHTQLLPALRLAVEQIHKGSDWTVAVFITDGIISDEQDCMTYCLQVGKLLATDKMAPIEMVLIGVGTEVDEDQLNRFDDMFEGTDLEGKVDLWSTSPVSSIRDEADILSVLYGGLMTEDVVVAPSGRVESGSGEELASFSDGMPGKFRFVLPKGETVSRIHAGEQVVEQDCSEVNP